MARIQKNDQKDLSAKLMVVLAAMLFALVTFGIILVRDKLLLNANELGGYLAQSYAREEEHRMSLYGVFMRLGTVYMNEHIERGSTDEEIQEELVQYSLHVQETLDAGIIDPYAVIDGKIIGAVPWEGDATYSYQDTEWYRKAIEAGGKLIYTNAYPDAVTGKIMVTMAQKLQGEGNVLAFDILLDNFYIHKNKASIPEDSTYFLYDGSGRLIYIAGDMDITDTAVQSYAGQLLEGVKSGKYASHSSSILDLSGTRQGVYYYVMNNGWISVITIPTNQILQGDVNIAVYVLAALCAILWIVLIIVLYLEYFGKRERKYISDSLKILGDTYYAIYRINFETGTYRSIKSSPDVKEQLGKEGVYSHMLDTVGKVVEESTYEEFKKSFSLENIRQLVEDKIYEFGGDYRRRFGDTYKWVSIRIIFNKGLGLNEVIMCFRDIDLEKQKQLQQHEILKNALSTSKKMAQKKSIFFSNVSHDMRTPLNAVIGLAALARQNQDDPAKVDDYLQKIEQSGKQLLALINDILDISRIEQGADNSMDYKPMDLQKCVADCASIFEEQAKQQKKRLHLSIDIQSPMVFGDLFRMNQILNNLLSNALKYSNEGADIFLDLKQLEQQNERGKYQITVRDTGMGMSEKFLGQIFEPFARETVFSPVKISGTGLGLPIVKSLVQQMSGEISVQSQLGKGSTFTILLPLQIAHTEEPAGPEPVSLEPFSMEGKTILLAEDNELNMEIATEFLSMMGVDVIQAWNGREAVERFSEQKPGAVDAILMDMQMPEMDGCTACAMIRKMDRPDAQTIPIIAVTANAFAEDIAKTTEAGMNAHISKPIDFHLLFEILDELSRKQTSL
ncbi:MAG TPA: response regulator [Candidatus Lachnoclostridium stercoravium]|uniref:Stage 0 sporulation protein A homolog n=1 Tax=Candidatus Lachnoclostridium stercoravium TaxID=2838633 RepID=A0A9D2HGG6_9FIRM|nr:response regulator [Candidatus Lachnoclostridium stercoravium]